MNYLKTLVINFLVVFFSDHILPGINVMDQTKLPHIGGDLITAAVLGVLNTLIYPVLRLFGPLSALKIALVALVLNFVAYAVIKLTPVGIAVTSVEGYIAASAVVAVGSFLTNFFEMKRHGSGKLDMPP